MRALLLFLTPRTRTEATGLVYIWGFAFGWTLCNLVHSGFQYFVGNVLAAAIAVPLFLVSQRVCDGKEGAGG